MCGRSRAVSPRWAFRSTSSRDGPARESSSARSIRVFALYIWSPDPTGRSRRKSSTSTSANSSTRCSDSNRTKRKRQGWRARCTTRCTATTGFRGASEGSSPSGGAFPFSSLSTRSVAWLGRWGGAWGRAVFLRGYLETLAADLGRADRVLPHEPVPHDEIPRYYRAADAVLVPSRTESFGLVALEASACGTPVVATD